MTPEMDTHRDALVAAAALRGPFEPKALFREILPDVYSDTVARMRILSALRDLCTVEKSEDGALWLLRPTPRQRALAEVEGRDDTEVGQALSGSGVFAPAVLDTLIMARRIFLSAFL